MTKHRLDDLEPYYGVPVQDLIEIAYICVITGIANTLAFFTLVGAIPFLLEMITGSSKKHKIIKCFQGISSNTTLRLVSSLPPILTRPYLMCCLIVYLDLGDGLRSSSSPC